MKLGLNVLSQSGMSASSTANQHSCIAQGHPVIDVNVQFEPLIPCSARSGSGGLWCPQGELWPKKSANSPLLELVGVDGVLNEAALADSNSLVDPESGPLAQGG